MKAQKRIRLHRFHDYVAFDLDDTETLYISAPLARKFAKQLNKLAKSVETESFQNSANGSPVIECPLDGESTNLKYSVKPLVVALKRYDKLLADNKSLWETVKNTQALEALVKAEKEGLRKVQEAFYKVTRDRNSLNTCYSVDIDFMRRCANRFKA